MAKQKHIFINRRRQNMMYVFLRPSKEETSIVSSIPQRNGILIFKSELDYISRCILDRPDIETGGQLFGYWSEDGRPIVMYAIGPGPKANHQLTFFNQDVDYLVKVGNALKENFGLKHIGEWHSHHKLGLARPSGHDANTMISTIRNQGLGEFILCIGNCDSRSSSIKAFLCDSTRCQDKEWDIICSDSPVRHLADSRLGDMLRHPRTRLPSHSDARMRNGVSESPAYAKGYWLNEKGGGFILNDIMNYLKRIHVRGEVKAQINDQGEVSLMIQDRNMTERIFFPSGFPHRPPVISGTRRNSKDKEHYWHYMNGNILGSFIHYYETI